MRRTTRGSRRSPIRTTTTSSSSARCHREPPSPVPPGASPLFARPGGRLAAEPALAGGVEGVRVGEAGAGFPVPPTISALIGARLDRLAPDDRTVLQEGSVIGLVFYQAAVEAMSPPALQPVVPRSIARLTRRQFVRPEPSTFMEETSFRFDHALIRDAAYRSLLKRERADLHERFAAWLEATAGARLGELEEIVGYHLEQSAAHLAELGPLDARGRALGARAAAQLASAGRRAFTRGDTPAAANLLGRAVALLPASEERTRVDLQLDLAEACADLGEFERSQACVADALATARAIGDELLSTNAALVQLYLRYTLDPQGRSDEVVRETEAAVAILESAADHVGLVRAWRLLAWVHGTACQYGAAERAVEQAVIHARLAGDRRAETRNLMSLALSALYGPTPVPDAIAIARRTVADIGDDRRAEGVALCALAHLHALRGEFDEATTLYRRAREMLEELGGRVMAATVSLDSGRVELLAGRPDAAEAELRRDYDALRAVGERYTLSTVAALMADAVLRQGRIDEALELAGVSEEAAAEDDVESQSLWRRIRARALAEEHRFDDAIALVHDALVLVERTDAPLLKANALADLAGVHAAAGRDAEALVVARQALGLFESKQDEVDARATDALIAGLEARGAVAAYSPALETAHLRPTHA